jgi:Mn2+/Fe2+ NRAMP family transporter
MSESSPTNEHIQQQAQELEAAEAQGLGATLKTYTKYSGPGWVQSAITLGGGSLSGALFLGILGGTSLLWLQLVAIIMGVIMLSAISYITLSTGKKPFQAINDHINPALGWGWIIATIAANMLWCMPQFSLCFAALQQNLVGDAIGDSTGTKIGISLVILAVAFFFLKMNESGSRSGKIFDISLKLLVGVIVLCFFAVVVILSFSGQVDWGAIGKGFIPNPGHWTKPGGEIAGLLETLPETAQAFWTEAVVKQQRAIMIGAAATAVGINMTFLLPYNLLSKGWNKSFRGISRFDLCTAMAIPYILATSCVVIAAASMFHAKVDEKLESTDSSIIVQSTNYSAVKDKILSRAAAINGLDTTNISDEEALAFVAASSIEERKIASSLVKRNAFQLSAALSPILGQKKASLVFGLGIFGMGFSTIIILMLINGYAFCELFGKPQGGSLHLTGCLAAGLCGAIWPLVWDGPAKLWLAILVSAFGMMLLPIAYSTFFLMMNSKKVMGDEKPKGRKMTIWNILMGISVLGAFIAAITAIIDKASNPTAGFVVTVAGAILLLCLAAYASAPKIKSLEKRLGKLENK